MNSVTQDMRFRQSLIKYSEKHGVTKAAIKYKTNRQYIYRWLRRYDGTLESLRERSRRPHHHPNQHTEQELKLIGDMRRRNPSAGLVVFWVKLRQRGYTRTVTGLYRVLRRNGEMAVKPKNPKYVPKPYERPCQVLCVNSRTTSGKLCDVAKRNRRVCQVTRPNHHPIGYPAYRG